MKKYFLAILLPLLLIFLVSCKINPPRILNVSGHNSVMISIDLCPSHKKYEKKLFASLERLGDRLGAPVPVAISVSGTWMRQHRMELEEIRKLRLDITWVNHSYTHPIAGDFLNNPKVDFRAEVLNNIKLMRACGLVPSKYFRFPGLRSNPKNLTALKKMGYVPLSADAWLAKNQPIRNGSIILVHGNGNDPLGVKLLLNYLRSKDRDLMDGKLTIISVKNLL